MTYDQPPAHFAFASPARGLPEARSFASLVDGSAAMPVPLRAAMMGHTGGALSDALPMTPLLRGDLSVMSDSALGLDMDDLFDPFDGLGDVTAD